VVAAHGAVVSGEHPVRSAEALGVGRIAVSVACVVLRDDIADRTCSAPLRCRRPTCPDRGGSLCVPAPPAVRSPRCPGRPSAAPPPRTTGPPARFEEAPHPVSPPPEYPRRRPAPAPDPAVAPY
jgi:hypothetical protein